MRAGKATLAIAATLVLQAPTIWRYFASAELGSDDEGYLTLAVQSWADGGALYHEVFSQYGPFHTLAFGLPLRLGDLTLSLSRGRALSAVLTAVTVALVAAAVWSMTRRLLVVIGSQLAVALVLMPTPSMSFSMHPGVLLCALLALLVLVVTAFRPRAPAWSDAATGAIAAGVLLTKLNVGLLLLAGLAVTGLSMLASTPPRTSRHATLRTLAEVAFVAMGPVLILSQTEAIRSGWSRVLPYNRTWTLVVWAACYAVSAAALVLAARRALPTPGTPEPDSVVDADETDGTRSVPPSARSFAGGFGLCAMAVLVIVLATGSSIGDVIDSVLLRPAGQARALAILPPLDAGTFGWLAVSTAMVAVALAVPAGRAAPAVLGASVRLGGAALLLWALVVDGSAADGALTGLLPLAALVLLVPSAASSPAGPPVRLLVGALAVGQSLHAFPVAGAQVAWASYLVVPVAALVLVDGCDQLRQAVAGRSRAGRTAAAAVPAMLFVAAMVIGFVDVASTTREAHDATVAVPTSTDARLRLPPHEAAWFDWLEGALVGCDEVVTSPGMNSLYVLLGIEPPTGFNTTVWTELLTDAEQQAIVDRLEAAEGPVCVVTAEEAFAELAEATGRRADQPLEIYLERVPARTVDAFGFWQVRRIGEP